MKLSPEAQPSRLLAGQQPTRWTDGALDLEEASLRSFGQLSDIRHIGRKEGYFQCKLPSVSLEVCQTTCFPGKEPSFDESAFSSKPLLFFSRLLSAPAMAG